VVGLLVAGGVTLIPPSHRRSVLETVIALVSPYAAYVLAETLHGSGVTAVVVPAWRSAPRPTRSPRHIRIQVDAVYSTVIFILEERRVQPDRTPAARSGGGAGRYRPGWPVAGAVITAALIVVRFSGCCRWAGVMQMRQGSKKLNWRRPQWCPGRRQQEAQRGWCRWPRAVDPAHAEDGTRFHRDLVLALATTSS